MNYILLEQWLVEMMPPEHKPAMAALVAAIKQDASMQFFSGWDILAPDLMSSNIEIKAAAINGLLMGICLGEAWKRSPTLIETNIKGFLEFQRKKRGENVFNFFTERARIK